LTSERVNNTGYGRRLALANEVEIEHALYSTRLETAVLKFQLVSSSGISTQFEAGSSLDEASCLWVEESVLGRGLSGLLGAAKRRMLSFADRPPSVEVVGAPFAAGTAEALREMLTTVE